MAEKQDAKIFAHQLFAHVSYVYGDADADLYVAKVVAELFEISPIVYEHISDLIFADLTDELHRRDQPGREAARLVALVQRDWAYGC